MIRNHGRGSGGDRRRDDGLGTVKSVDAASGRGGGGAGGVWGLVDVLAVNVDCVGNKGGAAVAGTGVALLEAEELQLGLDLFEDGLAHYWRGGEIRCCTLWTMVRAQWISKNCLCRS